MNRLYIHRNYCLQDMNGKTGLDHLTSLKEVNARPNLDTFTEYQKWVGGFATGVTFSTDEDLGFSPEGLARQAAAQTRFKVVNAQMHDGDMHIKECRAIRSLTDAYGCAAKLEIARIMAERGENVAQGLNVPDAFSIGEQRGSGQRNFLRHFAVGPHKLDFYIIFMD